jgi:hypothetical protein
MLEQTIHIKTPISKDDLETLISGLEAACGGNRIVVSEEFDLVVSNQRQALALKALFGKVIQTDKNIPVKYRPKKVRDLNKKKVSDPYPGLRNEMKTWRVLDKLGMVAEQITIEEKNHRLAAGEFETDTILHHPRAGRQRVTGEKGHPQVLEPS